jgi:hypothetical protein
MQHAQAPLPLGRGLLAALALAGLGACGLEYIPYIHEPLQGTPLGESFTFSSPPEVGLLFEGYEVYYKLYSSTDEASLAAESAFSTVLSMKAKGFQRLTKEGDVDEDLPLVEVPIAERGAAHSATVDFGDPAQPLLRVSWDTTHPLALRRGIPFPIEELGADKYQSFSDFSEADTLLQPTDLSRGVWEDALLFRPVRLALFVASYGRDELGGALYSEPVYLFRIDFYVAVNQ